MSTGGRRGNIENYVREKDKRKRWEKKTKEAKIEVQRMINRERKK